MGAPTILINNAGILASHTILTTSDAYLRKIFDVNVLSNWYTTKAFLPDMLRHNKGHIVTIASTASFVGVAGLADYTATKAAILSFHEGMFLALPLPLTCDMLTHNSAQPGAQAPLQQPKHTHHIHTSQLGSHTPAGTRGTGTQEARIAHYRTHCRCRRNCRANHELQWRTGFLTG
jgi:NAD(P)-dependent dehydrogenase (short-subunit alcohol dehydrogenase family)